MYAKTKGQFPTRSPFPPRLAPLSDLSFRRHRNGPRPAPAPSPTELRSSRPPPPFPWRRRLPPKSSFPRATILCRREVEEHRRLPASSRTSRCVVVRSGPPPPLGFACVAAARIRRHRSRCRPSTAPSRALRIPSREPFTAPAPNARPLQQPRRVLHRAHQPKRTSAAATQPQAGPAQPLSIALWMGLEGGCRPRLRQRRPRLP
ncbi:hypothetical protein BRADI_3g23348v3 [Brachypodium distachyon]|uniref:Uncharacterized protein n=1 Tax=Brachypodium distachyon TaxID=15368 RepID=A0A2K2CZ33_BRADI|nr:hypothetical protein BRADI_3g23348v3 [Brachypodium distachyon]